MGGKTTTALRHLHGKTWYGMPARASKLVPTPGVTKHAHGMAWYAMPAAASKLVPTHDEACA